MRIKHFDLIMAMLIAVVNVIWTQVPGRPLILSIIFALPLILVLPGYTLTQILFRKRPPRQSPDHSNEVIIQPILRMGHPIGIADQVILSLGLSLTIDVLVGFALNVFSIGLQALSWTLSLGLITTIFALLVMFLRRGEASKSSRRSRLHITMYDGSLLGLAVLVVAGAIWLSIIRPLSSQPSFSQFWMLPAGNHSCAISVGVQSFETTSITYRITVTVNGTQADMSSFVLAPQQKWEKVVTVKPGSASNIFIEAQLYRVDKPRIVYRNVHLTLYSSKGGSGRQVQHCTT